MVSKKKYILTVIVAVLVTAFLTLSLGNVLLVELGQKVVLSEEMYNEMSAMYEKYAKQKSEISREGLL